MEALLRRIAARAVQTACPRGPVRRARRTCDPDARVDEGGALVEHERVPSLPSSSAPLAALGAALLAASTPAHADPPPAAPPVVLAPPAAPGPAGAAWTRVHIVATRPGVVLERRQGSLPTDRPLPPLGVYAGEPVWEPVCTAPCDLAVQLGGEYRIAGEDVTKSSGFALHGPTTDLLVDAGAYPVRRAGVWLVVVGSIAAAAGAIFLGVNAVPKSGEASADILSPGGIASIAALAGGGTLGIVGIGLVIGGGTSVRDESPPRPRVGPPFEPVGACDVRLLTASLAPSPSGPSPASRPSRLAPPPSRRAWRRRPRPSRTPRRRPPSKRPRRIGGAAPSSRSRSRPRSTSSSSPSPAAARPLAIADHAGEREAWARRLGADGLQGPLVRFVDQHVFGAFEQEGGALGFITSDGARVCFRGAAARPEDRACVQRRPAAIVPVGGRLALLELAAVHVPDRSPAKAAHPAPRPSAPKHAAHHAHAEGHHPAKHTKKRAGHAAPSRRPSHPIVELFLRWVSADGEAEPEARSTGLHFESPLDGMALADARARPPGIDVLWFETAPGRRARILARERPPDGRLAPRRREPRLREPRRRRRRRPRVRPAQGPPRPPPRGERRGLGLPRPRRRGRSARPSARAPARPPDRRPRPCAPSRPTASRAPSIRRTSPPSIASSPTTRAAPSANRAAARARRLGRRPRLLPEGRALRSAALPDGAPRDEPPPFPARRARIAWGALAPDGEGVAFAGGAIVARRRAGGSRAAARGRRAAGPLAAPELPVDRRRAARIGATWWTARGPRLRVWPSAVRCARRRAEPARHRRAHRRPRARPRPRGRRRRAHRRLRGHRGRLLAARRDRALPRAPRPRRVRARRGRAAPSSRA